MEIFNIFQGRKTKTLVAIQTGQDRLTNTRMLEEAFPDETADAWVEPIAAENADEAVAQARQQSQEMMERQGYVPVYEGHASHSHIDVTRAPTEPGF